MHNANPIRSSISRCLRNRTFAASILGGGLFYLGTTAQVFLMALLLQVGFGFSALHAGLTLLAGAIGSTVMRFTLRPMLNVLGFRWMLIWNGLLTGACLAACGLFTAQTPLVVMLAVLFIAGFSRSTQFTGVQSLGYAEIPSAVMSPRDQLLLHDAAAHAELRRRPDRAGGSHQHGAARTRRHHHGRATCRTASSPSALLSALSVIIFYLLPPTAGSELTGVRVIPNHGNRFWTVRTNLASASAAP